MNEKIEVWPEVTLTAEQRTELEALLRECSDLLPESSLELGIHLLSRGQRRLKARAAAYLRGEPPPPRPKRPDDYLKAQNKNLNEP